MYQVRKGLVKVHNLIHEFIKVIITRALFNVPVQFKFYTAL